MPRREAAGGRSGAPTRQRSGATSAPGSACAHHCKVSDELNCIRCGRAADDADNQDSAMILVMVIMIMTSP